MIIDSRWLNVTRQGDLNKSEMGKEKVAWEMQIKESILGIRKRAVFFVALAGKTNGRKRTQWQHGKTDTERM